MAEREVQPLRDEESLQCEACVLSNVRNDERGAGSVTELGI